VAIVPTISAFYGILIQMFWRDHALPHFHALYGERRRPRKGFQRSG
jgi:hypothetical protein